MGIAKIALDPPPSVKRANVEKRAPKHPGKTLHPLATKEQNKQHISKKGFPLLLMIKLGVIDGFSVKDQSNFLII